MHRKGLPLISQSHNFKEFRYVIFLIYLRIVCAISSQQQSEVLCETLAVLPKPDRKSIICDLDGVRCSRIIMVGIVSLKIDEIS